MFPTLPSFRGAWLNLTDQDILSRLNRILCDLLSDDSIVLRMETRRDEVPNWDSFAYISFIVAVEMEFGIKFGVAEVESFENVGAIVRRLSSILSTQK
jgi:acyl carrier protein